MSRLVVIAIVLFLAYLLVRNIVRGFLRGMNPGNENVRRGASSHPKKDYKDVQDAEFKDITDEQ